MLQTTEKEGTHVKSLQERMKRVLDGGQVEKIVVHKGAHLDEWVATDTYKRTNYLPGIRTARIVEESVSGRKFWDRLRLGEFLIGQGDGPTDEHEPVTKNRRELNSSTQRALELTGMKIRTSVLREFFKEVTKQDSTGITTHALNVASVLNTMTRLIQQCGENSYGFKPAEWANTAIKAYHSWKGNDHPKVRTSEVFQESLRNDLSLFLDLDESDKHFHHLIRENLKSLRQSDKVLGIAYTSTLILATAGKKAAYSWTLQALKVSLLSRLFEEDVYRVMKDPQMEGKVFSVPLTHADGSPIVSNEKSGNNRGRIAVFDDYNNPFLVKASMAKRGGSATVVVNRNSKGQIQIFFNSKSYSIRLGVIKLVYAYLEQKEPGLWVFPNFNMILNGSFAFPDTTPTRLSVASIAELISISFQLAQTQSTQIERQKPKLGKNGQSHRRKPHATVH